MPMQPPPRQDKADPGQNMPASESAHPDRKESRDGTANFANSAAAMPDIFANLPSKSNMKGQLGQIDAKMQSLNALYART